jgi:hypothetical protein
VANARKKLAKRKSGDYLALQEIIDDVRFQFFSFFLSILKNYESGITHSQVKNQIK